VIIDAPGHKVFLKNMITGSSQAEAAVLIVDVNEGVKEQTKRHAYILELLGLKQVCVVINKMDLTNYSQERFRQVSEEVILYLNSIGITPSFIIPVSALKGDNIASASKNLEWFSGRCVLEALDSFSELKIEQKSFKFPVQDIYRINNKEIIVGRVEAGGVKVGDEVYILPKKKRVKIKSIERFPQRDVREASYGEAVGLCVEGVEGIKRGDILSEDLTPKMTRNIRAHIFWMEKVKARVGDELIFKCVTQEAICKITNIYRKFDPASMEMVMENADEISGGEVGDVEIATSSEVVICAFNEVPEMGRFVLEKGQVPVAGGIILGA
jgi:sulfate adenylyltransferase subunit 1 (EFTu-like GTPase family)